jgi:uncharacterized protein YndB with AHSA1/START domain
VKPAVQPFEISRLYDAPREKVWQAWTEPARLKQWWGPKGFSVTHLTVDLRPGGMTHYCLRSADGMEMWGRMLYREIVAPQRLVWINSFSDPKGGVTRHPGHAAWPLELHSTALFEAQGNRTKVTILWLPAEGSTEAERKTFDAGRASMNQGWTGTLDQLGADLRK